MNGRKTLELPHLQPISQVHPVDPNRTLDIDPILRAPPQSFRRPLRVMRRRFSWRGVPLPVRADDHGLAGAIGPSLYRPAALMGFNPSQVCSRTRLAPRLRAAEPTCLFIAPSDPICFRRVGPCSPFRS
jgi:hypothetical protein